MRIGIDVGARTVDASVVDGTTIRGAVKLASPTGTLSESLRIALTELHPWSDSVSAVSVASGRIHDAVRTGQGLTPVAMLRLARPSVTALAPTRQWPTHAREVVSDQLAVAAGGHDLSGRELASLDRDWVRRFAEQAAAAGARTLAITAAGAPVVPDHELEAAEIVDAAVPDLSVVLSHEFGGLGLRERENLTVLNAALRPLATRMADDCRHVLDDLGFRVPLLFVRNDSAAMNGEYLRCFPMAALDAGAAAALRGIALLAEVDRALACDIGSVSTRIAALEEGFPLRTLEASETGGIRVMLSRPEFFSTPVGGCLPVDASTGKFQTECRGVLPRLFGGYKPTLTDAAARLGLCTLSDRTERTAMLTETASWQALETARARLAGVVELVQRVASRRPLVAGGGAAFIAGAFQQSKLTNATGMPTVHVPEYADVAGAVGAASADPAVQVDRLVVARGQAEMQNAVDAAQEEALARVVSAGGDPGNAGIDTVRQDAVSYLPGSVRRIRVRAATKVMEPGRHEDRDKAAAEGNDSRSPE